MATDYGIRAIALQIIPCRGYRSFKKYILCVAINEDYFSHNDDLLPQLFFYDYITVAGLIQQYSDNCNKNEIFYQV